MRLLAAAASIAAPADAPKPLAAAPGCPRTTSYLAGKVGLYRGQPLSPKKLTELPSATAYMAVYRQIGGCEAPLTMVDYRNSRQR